MIATQNLLGILQDGNDLADTTPLSSAQPLTLVRGESAELRLQVRVLEQTIDRVGLAANESDSHPRFATGSQT